MTEPGPKRRSDPDTAAAARPPREPEVRAFLEANPGFLADNPDLMAAAVPEPDHGGDVVDLQGVLIARLRAENQRLQRHHAELLAASRANLATQTRIHEAALALLEARSFHGLMQAVTTDLAVKLDVDVVALAVENENGLAERTVSGIRLIGPGDVDRLMGPDRDVVLVPEAEPQPALYDAATGLVASEALLRLHASPEAPTGVLALGSREAGRFDPRQGTELLGHLARILELCIRTWLGLSRA